MIHPSYVDLMKVVNKDVEEGETPVINSRYSIVMATAKRARQIVDGDDPLVEHDPKEKPLSIAVQELNQGKIRILAEDEPDEYTESLALDEEELYGEGEGIIAAERIDEAEEAREEEQEKEESAQEASDAAGTAEEVQN